MIRLEGANGFGRASVVNARVRRRSRDEWPPRWIAFCELLVRKVPGALQPVVQSDEVVATRTRAQILSQSAELSRRPGGIVVFRVVRGGRRWRTTATERQQNCSRTPYLIF